MKETILKIKNSGAVKTLQEVLSSKFFPFITAVIFLFCYYLGWDMVLAYYVAFCGILILLLLDDVSPIITLMIFVSVLVTYNNSPSSIMLNSDYYFRAHNLAQVVTLLLLLFLSGAYRVAATVLSKKFVLTPVFYGLCAFSVALLCSGLFSNNYFFAQFLYGLGMAVCFLLVFACLKDNIKVDENLFERIAFSFFAFGLLLLIELFVKYISTENIIVNGEILRTKLVFGWGVWNTMGMFLVLCIPPVFYLAKTHKYGYLFTAFSTILFISSFMSCSRQAIIASLIIYPVCVALLLLNKKDRIIDVSILAGFLVFVAIIMIINRDTFVKFFIDLFKKLVSNSELDGNGRKTLWDEAVSHFKSAPIFGTGFFTSQFKNDPHFTSIPIIPLMAHNTLFELLSACGIIGVITYLAHRILTVMSFIKNVTFERSIIALTIMTILITSLFDNHIFYIFPTIIYSALLAVFVASENKEQLPISIQ